MIHEFCERKKDFFNKTNSAVSAVRKILWSNLSPCKIVILKVFRVAYVKSQFIRKSLKKERSILFPT